MAGLVHVNANDFDEKVLQAERLVLVEFGAPWCGPCKMLEPVLVELAGEYAGKVDFYTVDVDQSPQLAGDYGVMGVPTVIVFRNGQISDRVTGYRPRKALEKLLVH